MDLNRLAQSRIDQLTRSVSVDIDGQELNAVIRPGGISTDTQVRLAQARSMSELDEVEDIADMVTVIVAVLSELIVSWDVELDGKPLPVTREALSMLPSDVLFVLFSSLMSEVAEGPKVTSSSSKPSTKRAVKRAPNS